MPPRQRAVCRFTDLYSGHNFRTPEFSWHTFEYLSKADGSTMPARFQLVIDCKDPELLARFWAAPLGYVLEPPPEGFAN